MKEKSNKNLKKQKKKGYLYPDGIKIIYKLNFQFATFMDYLLACISAVSINRYK